MGASSMECEDFRDLTQLNSQEFYDYVLENVESSPSADLQNVLEIANAAMQDEMLKNEKMDSPVIAPEENIHLDTAPSLEPIDAGYHFDINMNGVSKDWRYSSVLKKLYIKMGSTMSINVSYPLTQEKLFVRAMILYDNPSDTHELVKRCANHKEAAVLNTGDSNPNHILKCHNPHAVYLGDESGTKFRNRLAVLVPLENGTRNDDGNYSLAVSYEFGCQNSCGNRKSTSIVFTLENSTQQLLGRIPFQFKVCSSPIRDCNHDLQEKSNSRKASGSKPSKRPKFTPKNDSTPELKTEPQDSGEWLRVMIDMPNKKCVRQVLGYSYDLIAGEMHRQGIPSKEHEEQLKVIQEEIDRLENDS